MTKPFKILWPQLGWCSWDEEQSPSRDQGEVSFLVIAPWCEDCREIGERFRKEAPKNRPIWLVGEFAPVQDTLAFAREFKLDWPVLMGRPEKSETARNEARFRDLRHAFGDTRKWGVPIWIHGRLKRGWFEAESASWPAS